MPTHPLNEPAVLAEQYRTSANLEARMSLHRRFATNPVSWPAWVFSHFDALSADARVLEVGCGNGALWRENAARIPAGWRIVLSDFSEGMVAQSRESLNHIARDFWFKQFSAQEVPFPDNTFDAVIANHMLYHVPDLNAALREIRRVLKPGGTLFAATNGMRHMKELDPLMEGFVENMLRVTVAVAFNLENGEESLRQFFERVDVDLYANDLAVTDAEALAAYILSMRGKMPEELRPLFHQRTRAAVEAGGGVYRVQSHTGLFIARKVG